jgi:hypothetical protein
MNSKLRLGGLAGIAAGPLLVLETASFLRSGWNPIRFSDPVQAMQLLRQGGGDLRLAAVFGFTGLVVTLCLFIGLADWLRRRTPAFADAVLYLGLIGIAGHSLVPLGLWIGIPMFLSLASHNMTLAQNSWAAFAATSNSAEGVGSLFMGLAMLLAGIAALWHRSFSLLLAWIAVIAGALTLITLLAIGTPLYGFASSLFFPSLIATVLFRFIAGIELWLDSRSEAVRAPA